MGSGVGRGDRLSRSPDESALVLVDVPHLARLVDDHARESALANIRLLLDAARRKRLTVFHCRLGFRADGLDGGHYFARNPELAAFADGPPADPDGLESRSDEIVVPRSYPSAFFGTSLAPSLRGLNVRAVILAGGTTSEAIRATAIDAMQHGFLPVVASDGVVDRSDTAHEESLVALARYGEVAETRMVVEWLLETSAAGA